MFEKGPNPLLTPFLHNALPHASNVECGMRSTSSFRTWKCETLRLPLFALKPYEILMRCAHASEFRNPKCGCHFQTSSAQNPQFTVASSPKSYRNKIHNLPLPLLSLLSHLGSLSHCSLSLTRSFTALSISLTRSLRLSLLSPALLCGSDLSFRALFRRWSTLNYVNFSWDNHLGRMVLC